MKLVAIPLSRSPANGAAREPRAHLLEAVHPLLHKSWCFTSPELSAARWHCRVTQRGWRPEHTRVLHTITFVHQGSYQYRNARGNVLADANVATFYNPGEPYSVAHPCGCGDSGSAFLLAADLVREVLLAAGHPAAAEADEPCFPEAFCSTSPRAVVLRELVLLRMAGGDEPLAIEETSLALLEELARSLPGVAEPGDSPRENDPTYVARAQSLMLTDFHRRLTLEELARAAYTTPFHLCRVFKRATSLTVHRYLTRLRLRTALDRLLTTETDIHALALGVGFTTHSHFTAAFRHELGCTPSQVRRAASSRQARERLAERLQA